MAEELSDQQVNEIRNAFSVFDNDGDGTITIKELGTVMRSLGQNPTDKHLQSLINEFDEDEDGVIDFQEFLVMMARTVSTVDWEAEIKESYRQDITPSVGTDKVFDKEKKGYVAAGDLRYILSNVGNGITKQEIDEIMAALDQDGDGQITYDEFLAMVTGENKTGW